MNKPTIFLKGKKVYLRPFEEKDLELYYFGRNNPDVRETLFLFYPITLDQVRNEINSLLSTRDNLTFTIIKKSTHEAVGQTSFVRIDYVSRMATFFLAIWDPVFWSRGFGTEATQLMVEYGFDILNLNRIQLHVAVENKNAIKAYEKCGFKIEGTLREAMYHHNRYCDFHLMAILRSEFYSMKQNK